MSFVVEPTHRRQLVKFLQSDTSQTIREVGFKSDVSIPTILDYFCDIDKVKKLDRWVPHELNAHQIKKRFDACVSLLSWNKREPFRHRIVTCDKKWILYDNRKRSVSCLDKNEALKHSPKPKIHQNKLMITAWWSRHGLIHYSFVKLGQSIAAETYCN